jgi:general secretion pathway protein H
MPTSDPGSNERGFTLVELMVVVTVIALASAIAVLAMPDPRGRVFDEAARFATRSKAARDVAIVEGTPVSLWITAGGYGFDRRAGQVWTPISDKPFRLERWRDGTRAAIGAAGRNRLTFDPTGLADRPMSVTLTRDRASATARIDANGSARVE